MRKGDWSALGLALVLGVILSFVLVPNPAVEAQPGVRTPIQCSSSIAVTGNTAVTAELVALAAGKRVYVCSATLTGGGATTVTLKSGTGAACAGATVNLTGALELGDNTAVSFGGGQGYVLRTTAGHALCWTNSGAVQVIGLVSYAQF